jgi:hypothetical protein
MVQGPRDEMKLVDQGDRSRVDLRIQRLDEVRPFLSGLLVV